MTPILKARTPRPVQKARVLIIGTGVDLPALASVHPSAQSAVVQAVSSGDVVDTFGHGTLAASVILQMLPNVTITSFKVPLVGGNPVRADLKALAAGLALAKTPGKFDAVLLAFPPSAAVDPMAYLATQLSYGSANGTGLDMLWKALLSVTPRPDTATSGIPLDKALRDRVFARASSKQRDAVERYVARVQEWKAVVKGLADLDAAGISVIAPTGDYVRKDNPTGRKLADLRPAFRQSVYGISARPEVLTVGSALQWFPGDQPDPDDDFASFEYAVSPASGLGPTLQLGLKPDLVAPANVPGLVPESAILGAWVDALDHHDPLGLSSLTGVPGSGQVPAPIGITRGAPTRRLDGLGEVEETAARLEWAIGRDVACPARSAVAGVAQRKAHCVLQGSSVVSAAFVAANVAALVRSGEPSPPESRQPEDDEIVRGLALAASQKAGLVHTLNNNVPSIEDRAKAWQMGTGVFLGFGGLVPANALSLPVPLAPFDLGEVSCAGVKEPQSVALWVGGAAAGSARLELDQLLYARHSDQTMQLSSVTSGPTLSVTAAPRAISIGVDGPGSQGGMYLGWVVIETPVSAGSQTYRFPFSVVQNLCPTFHVDYAYNEFQTSSFGGAEGERVEDATVLLLPAIPASLGSFSDAFKYLQDQGLTPQDTALRIAVTHGGTEAATTEEPYGVAMFQHPGIPPGYWRFHVASDFSLDGLQSRSGLVPGGVPRSLGESLGLKLGGGGPEALSLPGAMPLVFFSSLPACAQGQIDDPGQTCISPSDFLIDGKPQVDQETGFCRVTDVGVRVYCQEAALSVPATVASRAVHLVEFSDDPARSELKKCSIAVRSSSPSAPAPKPPANPAEATKVDLDALAKQAATSACTTDATAPSWTFTARAPDCLGPLEQNRDLMDDGFRNGLPTDVTGRYTSALSAGSSGLTLPIGTLTYPFAVPSPNVLTTVAVNFSYKVENAVVAVRVHGRDAISDVGGGVLVVRDDPKDPSLDMQDAPQVTTAYSKGSVHGEWMLLTSGATWGHVSILTIPTAVVTNDPSSPRSTIQICDLAVRVKTYAKSGWGTASSDPMAVTTLPVQTLQTRYDHPSGSCPGALSISWCRLSDQIQLTGTAKQRVRTYTEQGSLAFQDLDWESEDALIAVHVPKDTTVDPVVLTNPHRVRDPDGLGAAYLLGIRNAAKSAAVQTPSAADPRLGVTEPGCKPLETEDPQPPGRQEVCALWNEAVAKGEMLLELPTSLRVNGRFFGYAAAPRAALRVAGGAVSWTIADGSDNGAFDQYWTNDTRIPLTTFLGDDPSDRLDPTQSVSAGSLSLSRDDRTGRSTLTLYLTLPGGDLQTVRIAMACVAQPDGTPSCT